MCSDADKKKWLRTWTNNDYVIKMLLFLPCDDSSLPGFQRACLTFLRQFVTTTSKDLTYDFSAWLKTHEHGLDKVVIAMLDLYRQRQETRYVSLSAEMRLEREADKTILAALQLLMQQVRDLSHAQDVLSLTPHTFGGDEVDDSDESDAPPDTPPKLRSVGAWDATRHAGVPPLRV